MAGKRSGIILGLGLLAAAGLMVIATQLSNEGASANPATGLAPLAEPTPCSEPCGLEFSISGGGHGVDACSTRPGEPTKCTAALDRWFTVTVHVDSLRAQDPGYYAYLAALEPAGLEPVAGQIMPRVWPSCHDPYTEVSGGVVIAQCFSGSSKAYSMHAGALARATFLCAEDGSITLKHDEGWTAIFGDFGESRELSGDETLLVNCVAHTDDEADTDGDSCPDGHEAGASAMSGGLRDFMNPYDYFDPTNDGRVRVADIALVVAQFGIDEGEAGYDAELDRTLVGPNAWNLGAPNGRNRTDDIVNIVRQFNHDCLMG